MSDKLAKDNEGNVIFNDNFKVDGSIEITPAGDLYMNSTQIFDIGGINFSSNESGINLNGNSLIFSSSDDISIYYDEDNTNLVFSGYGTDMLLDSDGYLTIANDFLIQDDRVQWHGQDMFIFNRSGSSSNYRYNIDFQENDITNTGTIYTYGGARIDSDGCIYNEDNTAIEIKTSDRSGNTELNHSYLYLDSDGDGFELNSKGNQTGKVIAVKSDTPNAFSHDIAYTFKEDSIYRKVDNGNDVDLIPHLYRHIINLFNLQIHDSGDPTDTYDLQGTVCFDWNEDLSSLLSSMDQTTGATAYNLLSQLMSKLGFIMIDGGADGYGNADYIRKDSTRFWCGPAGSNVDVTNSNIDNITVDDINVIQIF